MLFLVLALGIFTLALGAELLVRSASSLAALVGLSPLVIGLTVVAMGTGSPEVAVCVQAAFTGDADIALGNVVGSNIANILLILGASALITPLMVSRQLIRREVPLMIAVSLAVLVMGLDGSIGRGDGVLLVLGMAIYTTWAVRQGQREPDSVPSAAPESETGAPPRSLASIGLQCVLLIAGLSLLILGARWFSGAAVQLAVGWGGSQFVVGLTVVAVGTSLPELATTILAAFRGERDIAVGNVIGSNLFNLMGVLGATSVLSSNSIDVPAAALRFDLPVMLAVAVACLPIFFTGQIVARWEGALFLGYYLAYTGYLILSPTSETGADLLEIAMLGFVIPLTVIRLGMSVVRALRAHRAAG